MHRDENRIQQLAILFHGSNSVFSEFDTSTARYSDGFVCFSKSPLHAGCYGKFIYACLVNITDTYDLTLENWLSGINEYEFCGEHVLRIYEKVKTSLNGNETDNIFYAIAPDFQILISSRFQLRHQLCFDEVIMFEKKNQSRMPPCYEANLTFLPKEHPSISRVVNEFLVDRVREFFAGKPFKFRVDASLSVRAAVRDLLHQARTRQAELPGSRYEGAVLQHLIGAKLELVLPQKSIVHHSASEADQAEGRAGDFEIGDVAIHATTHPGEALIQKCRENISAGLRPVIVTVPAQTAVADGLADAAEILDKLEVLDIEQFLAANLHERAFFQTQKRSAKTAELLDHYNRLIDAHETDPSLKIEIAGK